MIRRIVLTRAALLTATILISGCSVYMLASRSSYKDIYKIDADAHRAGSKGAAVAGHLVADILTLGLWEIVGTPLELAAQDRPVTFILKYNAEEKLIEMETVK